MTLAAAQARVMTLLNVAGVTAQFPNGPKEVVRGASVAIDASPGLLLLLPFEMARRDPGTTTSLNCVRTYGFTVVAMFLQAQDKASYGAEIAAAVDALIDALEGKLLLPANTTTDIGIERVKVRSAGVADELPADESFLQYALYCTGEIYEVN